MKTTIRPRTKFESPQMWDWPQMPCGGSPPSPTAIGKAFPLPPSSPHPFLPCSGRGRPRLVWGRAPRAQGGWRGSALQAALGARPTSGGTVLFNFQNHYMHEISIFKLFRELQLQLLGVLRINFHCSYTFLDFLAGWSYRKEFRSGILELFAVT